jgi:hypothetical protein
MRLQFVLRDLVATKVPGPESSAAGFQESFRRAQHEINTKNESNCRNVDKADVEMTSRLGSSISNMVRIGMLARNRGRRGELGSLALDLQLCRIRNLVASHKRISKSAGMQHWHSFCKPFVSGNAAGQFTIIANEDGRT